jgi:hypothetical protein
VRTLNRTLNVYDLDEFGIGPLITRQGFLARSSGEKKLELWSADWKIPAGHRIAVRVIDANEDWRIHTPLLGTVQVMGGSVTLPFLTYQRTIQGDPGTQLEDYLSETIAVPPEIMWDSVSSSFQLPPPQQPRP